MNSIYFKHFYVLLNDGIFGFGQYLAQSLSVERVEIGARGLRSIVEAIMIDAMFELPSTDCKELHITRAYAEEKMKKANMHILH